jgi:hypothetical protein
MMEGSSEIMTLEETAKYLKMSSCKGRYMRTVRISSKFSSISEQFGYERVK